MRIKRRPLAKRIDSPTHRKRPLSEDHWAIVDLIGKAGHIRTVPVPDSTTDPKFPPGINSQGLPRRETDRAMM